MWCATNCGNSITNETLNVRQLCCGQYFHLDCLLRYFQRNCASLVFTEVSESRIVLDAPENIFCPHCRQPFINLSNCVPGKFKRRLSALLLFYLENSRDPKKIGFRYRRPQPYTESTLSLQEITEKLLADVEFKKMQDMLQQYLQSYGLMNSDGFNDLHWKELLDAIDRCHLSTPQTKQSIIGNSLEYHFEIAQLHSALKRDQIQTKPNMKIEIPFLTEEQVEPTYPAALGTTVALILILVIALFVLPRVIRWEEEFMLQYHPERSVDTERLSKANKRCTSFAIAIMLMAITLNKRLFVGRETLTASMLKSFGGSLLLLSLVLMLPKYNEPI